MKIAFTTVILFFAVFPALASYDGTEAERAVLPEYCQFAQTPYFGGESYGIPSDGAKRMLALYGESHWHNHHYCWGQLQAMRSYKAGMTKPAREHLIGNAVSEADYMIRNAEKGFVLLPEIWTFRGTQLLRLRKNPEALASFNTAIKIDKAYVPAHLRKLDYLRSMGDTAAVQAAIAEFRAQNIQSEAYEKAVREGSSVGVKNSKQ